MADSSEKKKADDRPKRARPNGVHVAYSEDGKAVLVDTAESKVLKYALRNRLYYVFWPFGVTFDEAVAADKADQQQS